MRFKRQEAFRYQFGQPLACTFRIVRIGDEDTESDKGTAEIYDISPRGMRIRTSLDIPPHPKDVHVQIVFTLNDAEFAVLGTFVWQKRFANVYDYGLKLDISYEQEEMLIREIKRYALLHASRRNRLSR